MSSKTKSKIDPKCKAFVRDTARTAAWNIGFSEYHMDVDYMKDNKESGGGGFVAAEMHVDRRYLRCTIRVYPVLIEDWAQGEKENVRECIVHEVAHLATEHMKDLIYSSFKDEGETKDAWESLTTRIGNMARRIDDLETKKK